MDSFLTCFFLGQAHIMGKKYAYEVDAMKKSLILWLLAAALMLLSSCRPGFDGEETAKELQKSFAGAEQIRFTADIRADYGDRVWDFSVSFRGTAGEGEVTVTSPQEIAGTTLRFSAGESYLLRGDREIYTGEILPQGLSPADVLPMLLDQWAGGLIVETVRENLEGEECLSVLFRVDERVTARTWFTLKTLLPKAAEVTLDGFTVVMVKFGDVVT